MEAKNLDLGLYTNIFQVKLPDESVSVMTASTNTFASLGELREQIQSSSQNIRVYRHEDIIFGYGSDQDWLADKGFQKQPVSLYDHPRWCTRMIVEGLVDHLKPQGYHVWQGIGRTRLYDPQPIGEAARGYLRIFRGYDLRAIYFRNVGHTLFGLVVDVCWKIQNSEGGRLSPPEIAQYNATTEIAQLQDEFLPNNRLNPEVARLRLQNHVLPFVQSNSKFALPCGGIEATLDDTPLRVILGVEA